jgi:hypothetical protein
VTIAPASAALDRVVGVLERIVPVAAAIRRGTLRLAAAAAAAGALIVYAVLHDGTQGIVAEVVVAVLAAAPPVVLGAFWLLLRELVELPDRIRRLPGEGREHVEELGRLAREARGARQRGFARVPGTIWRLTRLTGSSRELLTPYAPLLPLFSVPFLTAVAFAAAGVFVEVAIALVALLVLAL